MKATDLLRSPLTELPRLDAVIEEHEQLNRRFSALINLLVEKKLITHDEAVRLRTVGSN
jgi:hypothetical protein